MKVKLESQGKDRVRGRVKIELERQGEDRVRENRRQG